MSARSVPLVERLRSSAKAFRENSVYTLDGDDVRLGVQAAEMDEAASTIELAIGVISDLLETGLSHSSKYRKASEVLAHLLDELRSAR